MGHVSSLNIFGRLVEQPPDLAWLGLYLDRRGKEERITYTEQHVNPEGTHPLCSEELARKLATARAEKKALNELLSTTHVTGSTPDANAEDREAATEGQEEQLHLVLIVKADTQACYSKPLLPDYWPLPKFGCLADSEVSL